MKSCHYFNVFIFALSHLRMFLVQVSDNAVDEHFYGGPSIFQCIRELLYRIKGARENSIYNLRETEIVPQVLQRLSIYPGLNQLCQTILTFDP